MVLTVVTSAGSLSATAADGARAPSAAGPPSGVGVIDLPSAVVAPTRGWAWPLAPDPRVVRGFDPPGQPWLAGHRGVDLSASVGQVVRSPAAGMVTYAGRLAGRGVLVIAHEGGLRSTLEPVTPTTTVGSTVAAGDVVGAVSSEPGHCAPAACLHWGVLRVRTYLDPLTFVGRGPVLLLPMG